jgi:hypothetical protein
MRERSQRVATLSDIGTIEASQSLHQHYIIYKLALRVRYSVERGTLESKRKGTRPNHKKKAPST